MPDPAPPGTHPGLVRVAASIGIAASLTFVVLGLGDSITAHFEWAFIAMAILESGLLGETPGGVARLAGAVFLAVLSAVVWVVLRLLDSPRTGPIAWVARASGIVLNIAAAAGAVRLASQLVVWRTTRPEAVFCVVLAILGLALATYTRRPLEALVPPAVGVLAAVARLIAPDGGDASFGATAAALRRLPSSEVVPIVAMILSMAAAWALARGALGALLGPRSGSSLVFGVALAAAAGVALTVSLRPERSHLAELAWGGTDVVDDKPLKALLKPTQPLEADDLRIGTDGATYYTARFVADPPAGALEEYEKAVRRRGVLMAPIPTSPHALPQAILGYEFLLVRTDPARPHVLWTRQYGDSRYPENYSPWRGVRDAPWPFVLEGRILIVRLGQQRDLVWSEADLVPDRDVAEVEEYPFPRAPGAVLVEADTRPSPGALSGPREVARSFVSVAAFDAVLTHYEGAWRGMGFDVERTRDGLTARAPEGVAMARLTVEPWSPPIARGLAVALSELPTLAPELLASSPEWPTFYRVGVTFTDARAAADFLDDARHAGEVGVLACAYSSAAEDFVRGAGQVPVRLSSNRDLPAVSVWLIPAGGLSQSRNDDELRARLAAHVERGGALVVTAQQKGQDYAALPVPRGETIEAWGWDEDPSTYSEELYASAVYANVEHPVLASVVTATLPSNLDGHFERLPAGAIVLLRRTKDGAPVMAAYRYGRGTVIVSTSYDIGGFDRLGPGSPAVLRDALTWAAGPAQVPEVAAGQPTRLRLRVVNRGPRRAAAARLTVMAPGRERVAAQGTVAAVLEPGASAEITLPVALDPESEPGLYTVDYALLGPDGAMVQRTQRDGIARLAVTRPPSKRFAPPEITVAVMSPDGEEVAPGQRLRMRYVVQNRSPRVHHVRIYEQFGPTRLKLVAPRALAPGERVVGETEGTLKLGQRGFWIHVFEDKAASGRCPSWLIAVESETGGCQAADGEGIHVRPPSTP